MTWTKITIPYDSYRQGISRLARAGFSTYRADAGQAAVEWSRQPQPRQPRSFSEVPALILERT